MLMLENLTALWEFLSKLPPRFAIIQPDELGIMLSRGEWKCNLDPGYYWYWPIISSVRKVNAAPQFINLPMQTINGISISCGIEYVVTDPHDAILKVQDYDISVPNYAMGYIADFLPIERCQRDLSFMARCIQVALNEDVEAWGLKVTKVIVHDFSPSYLLRIANDSAPSPTHL